MGAFTGLYAQDTQAAEDNHDNLRPQLHLEPPKQVDRDTQQDNVCQDRDRCNELAPHSRHKSHPEGLGLQEQKANIP